MIRSGALKPPEANDLLDLSERTPVVVLDDMAGGEKGGDYTRGLLVTILERRLQRDRQTIVTSNLSLGQLSEFLVMIGSQVVSQAQQATRSKPVAPTNGCSREHQRHAGI
jgi:DNA replication protein DnaC